MARLTPSWQLPRFHQDGLNQTASLLVRSQAGQVVAVGTGSYNLYDADGTAAIDQVSIIAADADGGISIEIETGDLLRTYTLPQPGPWREVWSIAGLSGGEDVEHFQRLVFYVRVRPHPVITATQLEGMHPEWARQMPQAYTDAGQPIEDAWVEMMQRLLGSGLDLHRVLNWYTFGVPHKYLAAHFVARAFASDNPTDSRWERRAAEYLKRYETELEHRITVIMDSDEDGVADSGALLQHAEPELFLADRPSGFYSDWGDGWM